MKLKTYEVTYDETETVTGSIAGNVVTYEILFSNQGTQGPQGPQGDPGPQGPKGLDGNTNYIRVYTPQTLVIGQNVSADTSSGPLTLTLPSTPELGNFVDIYDHSDTFDVNNLTLGRNGEKIEGLNENLICNIKGAYFTVLYVGASRGWQVIPHFGMATSASSILYNTTIPDPTLNILVGGATPEPASTWKTRTFMQALDTILFPTINPTTTSKSASLAISGTTGVLEVGTSNTRTLTTTFNRGQITNGNGTSGPLLVGAATTYTYSGTNLGSTASGDSLTLNTIITAGSNSWQVTVAHGAGSGTYYDNKGGNSSYLDGQRISGSVVSSASSPTILGVYPWYVIKSPVSFTAGQFRTAIINGNATNIDASATLTRTVGDTSGTINVPFNVSNKYIGIAYETLSTLKNRYYITEFDQDVISNAFNYASQGFVNTGYQTRTFHMHISKNTLTNTNAILELRNS